MAAGLLSSVLLLPITARAEVKGGSVEVTPFAGFNFFENGQNVKDRFIYGGRIGYNLTPHWGIEGSVDFINTHVDDKSKNGNKEGRFGGPTNHVDMTFYHLDALYHFMPAAKFNPYLIAGIGGVHYSPRISTQDMTALNFGVGAKYWVADNVALRIDARDNVVSEVFKNAYHNINTTVGIVFAFGGTSTAPARAVAGCPDCLAPVESKDTTAPYTTLASPDNASKDASLDREIRVAFSEAMDPATINSKTFILYQGKSVVPGTVTTPTGTTASFKQEKSLAPDTIYTGRITTGAKDLAGNPLANDYVWVFKTISLADPKVITNVKTKVETKVVVVNKLVMLEDTHFEFNKSDLSNQGKEILKQNVKIMQDNPDIKVRIAGYASAAGSTEYNQNLSERRANSVMSYMVSQGVAPERLETIGYGETRPAIQELNPSDLESKAAKNNMRVLFEIIEK